MTPARYLDLIVLPTLAEVIADSADQRRAYLACITAAHLVDHVSVTLPRHHGTKPDVWEVRSALGRLGPGTTAALEIVEAVCNGTKHSPLLSPAALLGRRGFSSFRIASEKDIYR